MSRRERQRRKRRNRQGPAGAILLVLSLIFNGVARLIVRRVTLRGATVD